MHEPTIDGDDPFARIHQSSGGLCIGRESDIPVDIVDEGDHFELVADLPGYGRDEIEVDLDERKVHLSADPHACRTNRHMEFVLRERRRQPVSRTMWLPDPVCRDEAVSLYREGVLVVVLPKADRNCGDAHRISIC